MATYTVLRHPDTILVTVFTKPDNLTNDLLIINFLIEKTYLKEDLYDNGTRTIYIYGIVYKSNNTIEYSYTLLTQNRGGV